MVELKSQMTLMKIENRKLIFKTDELKRIIKTLNPGWSEDYEISWSEESGVGEGIDTGIYFPVLSALV